MMTTGNVSPLRSSGGSRKSSSAFESIATGKRRPMASTTLFASGKALLAQGGRPGAGGREEHRRPRSTPRSRVQSAPSTPPVLSEKAPRPSSARLRPPKARGVRDAPVRPLPDSKLPGSSQASAVGGLDRGCFARAWRRAPPDLHPLLVEDTPSMTSRPCSAQISPYARLKRRSSKSKRVPKQSKATASMGGWSRP